MATEVNQNYFSWSQEESSVQDISQGTTKLFGHGSISFGRFDLESLEWEKWSVFTNDRRHEEFGKFNGLVAKKKAYFEEYFKKIRELKALQQQNQQTELNLDYSGDGSDSSQTGEDEPAADHEAPTGSGTLVDDSREQKIPTTKFEHEVECHDDENRSLVAEISASAHSSSVGALQQIGKHVGANVSGSIDMSLQNAYSSQDDPRMVHENSMTPKRTIEKESRIGQVSKIIPKTVNTTSSTVPAQTIPSKGPCSAKPGAINKVAKAERRPIGANCGLVGTTGGSGIAGLRRPSTASQRPSTREGRPITSNASKKPAGVTTSCRPSTSERRSANNTTPCRPSTADRRPISKESAPKQSNIATPSRSSTADRRIITKESAPKLSGIATPRRPSTADRRPTTKESAPTLSNIASPHRPTGKRRTTTSDMVTKHVGIDASCRPSTDKQRPVSRQSACKPADAVTLRRPSTAERRPVTRDAASKHALVPPPQRPSTSERHPTGRGVAPKLVPLCRPSTAERRLVTRESALRHANAARSRCPLTPDRYLSKKSENYTPQRPSTGNRCPVTNDSTLKSDKKTPFSLRAVPNYLNGAMFAEVTPRKAVTPNLVKSRKPENISYAKEKVDGKPKSSSFNLQPRKMLTSNVRDNRVLDGFRKPNKEGSQERVQAQAFASNNTTPLQTRSVKTRAPMPPPPPPPPRRPSSIERTADVNNLPASGRKPKASTPHWH